MEITSSIRTELEHYITKNNLTLSRFAEIAGMNCGTISTILKGQRSIAVNQLDKIIAGIELPPGSLYENASFTLHPIGDAYDLLFIDAQN